MMREEGSSDRKSLSVPRQTSLSLRSDLVARGIPLAREQLSRPMARETDAEKARALFEEARRAIGEFHDWVGLNEEGHRRRASNVGPVKKLLAEALDLDPSLQEGWFWLGGVNNALQLYREADNCFRKALDLSWNEDAAIGLGFSLLAAEDWQGLIDIATGILKKGMTGGEARQCADYFLGAALLSLGREEEALPALHRAAEYDFPCHFKFQALAGCLLGLGRNEELVGLCEQNIQALSSCQYYPGNKEMSLSGAYRFLALGLQNLGRESEADSIMDKYSELAE